MEIKKTHVVITGANRGIGKAVAEMFAQSGAHLILGNRTTNTQLVEDLLKQGAASVEEMSLDLSKPAKIEQFVEKLDGRRVDILFNNAGQLIGGLFEDQDVSEMYQMMQVNLLGLMHLTRLLLPAMVKRKKGKIINNASVTGITHLPSAAVYGASKAGIIAFTDCLRMELRKTGVSTLLLITPGVETRMFGEIPKKHGDHFDLKKMKGMDSKVYAEKIKEAIREDLEILRPSGASGWFVRLAQYSPQVYEKVVMTRFRR